MVYEKIFKDIPEIAPPTIKEINLIKTDHLPFHIKYGWVADLVIGIFVIAIMIYIAIK